MPPNVSSRNQWVHSCAGNVWNQTPVEWDKGCISSQQLSAAVCITEAARSTLCWKVNAWLSLFAALSGRRTSENLIGSFMYLGNLRCLKLWILILGRWKHLSTLRRMVKLFRATSLFWCYWIKKPGVAVKCSLFSQHSVLGTGCRPKHLDDACAMHTWEPAEPGSPRMASVFGWLRAPVARKKSFFLKTVSVGLLPGLHW